MTEQEWLECGDPQQMLRFLRGKASERKLRLLAVACCRRIWRLLSHERSRSAVEAAERFADGLLGREGLAAHWVAHDDFPLHSDEEVPSYAALYAARESAWSAARDCPANAASEEAWAAVPSRLRNGHREEVRRAAARGQADLLRDLFGPLPFRPVALNPAWLTFQDGAIRKLARAVYEERELPGGHLDNGRLAVLADALEEAGCHDADLLGHLRGPGPHVRGCWVLDLIAGRE